MTLAPGSTSCGSTAPGLGRASGYDAQSDLSGFLVVVCGTTAPDWEREIWAGNVNDFTVPGVPLDQLVFGVKAVDEDGHASPAAPYVPVPRRF